MEDVFNSESFFVHFDNYAKELSLSSEFCLSKEKSFVTEEIDSTNSYLMRLSSEMIPSDFNLNFAAAASQTKGRGRMGRHFYSPKNTGIYFSFAISPENGVEDPADYTITSVVGVCIAIEKLFNVKCSIKWVNDIYLDEKKICGILTEGVVNIGLQKVSSAIVGIGINITTDENLPEEIKNRAGGITSEKTDVTRTQLLACSMANILKLFENGNKSEVMKEYKVRSMLDGKKITVTPVIGTDLNTYDGIVLGITDDAGLRVKLSDGTERILRSGEVSLHQSL